MSNCLHGFMVKRTWPALFERDVFFQHLARLHADLLGNVKPRSCIKKRSGVCDFYRRRLITHFNSLLYRTKTAWAKSPRSYARQMPIVVCRNDTFVLEGFALIVSLHVTCSIYERSRSAARTESGRPVVEQH
jgi:hypothetical protein